MLIWKQYICSFVICDIINFAIVIIVVFVIIGQMDFIVSDSTGTVFNSTALPTSLSLDQFQTGGFTLVDFASADFLDRANLGGNFQTLTVTEVGGTPEPSTWLLLVTGAGLLAGMKRVRAVSGRPGC